MANVAFIGTGLLGSGMVEGMLRRGDTVSVWNRTESKARALEQFGAHVAGSPADAVAAAERVHMTLPDDDVVDSVMRGYLPRLRPHTVVIDHSTTAPKRTGRRVAQMAAESIRFLHAPVFMSPQMTRESTGIMIVAGPQATYDAVHDPLAAMTGEVWYVGAQGDVAASYKLFGNSMLFVITAGLTDVFVMAKSLGMAPADAMQVFARFQLGGLIKLRGDKMARGDFGATFELAMARKDMRLMLEAAGDQPMTVLPAIARQMDKAIADGHAKDDLGAIAAELVR